MEIRAANINEYDDVIKFYDDIIDGMQDHKYHPMWQKRVYPTLDFLKESIANKQLYIQIVDANIVGAMVINHYGNGYDTVKWSVDAKDDEIDIIHALGVAVKLQGQGYATKLVEKAIELAKENKRKAVRLDVLAPNLPAHELYKKQGFQLAETKELFYEDTGWTKFMLYEFVL